MIDSIFSRKLVISKNLLKLSIFKAILLERFVFVELGEVKGIKSNITLSFEGTPSTYIIIIRFKINVFKPR